MGILNLYLFASQELSSWFSLTFSGSKTPKVRSFSLLTIVSAHGLVSDDLHLDFEHDCVFNFHICLFSVIAMCLEKEHIPKV